MLDIFAAYATDEAAELNGVWKNLNGAELLIARAGNRKYAKLLTARVEAGQSLLDSADEEVAAKASDEIMAGVFAETILLGWKPLKFKGEVVEYSKETAKQMLLLKDFRREVARLSDDMEAYRVKVEEAQVKN